MFLLFDFFFALYYTRKSSKSKKWNTLWSCDEKKLSYYSSHMKTRSLSYGYQNRKVRHRCLHDLEIFIVCLAKRMIWFKCIIFFIILKIALTFAKFSTDISYNFPAVILQGFRVLSMANRRRCLARKGKRYHSEKYLHTAHTSTKQ